MKASEIRELNASELEKKLADLKKELFNLRFSMRSISLTILTRSTTSRRTSPV